MGETLTVGLTQSQRELVLRGLRFVRSSVLLETREPSTEIEAERADQLQEINSLVSQLSDAPTSR